MMHRRLLLSLPPSQPTTLATHALTDLLKLLLLLSCLGQPSEADLNYIPKLLVMITKMVTAVICRAQTRWVNRLGTPPSTILAAQATIAAYVTWLCRLPYGLETPWALLEANARKAPTTMTRV
jgi:hypothetical protein